MIRQHIGLLCLLLLCGSLSTFAEDAPLTTLEALVKQWVGLRSQIAEEQQGWKQKQQQWQREIALLDKENQQLDDAIAHAAQYEAAKESQIADQLARNETLLQIQQAIDPILIKKVAELANLRPRIPDTLLSDTFKDTCRELSAQTKSIAPARRLQLLTLTLSEIETLRNQSHYTRELIQLEPAQRREMDVVYLGLARGFALSPDNATAAIGISTATGWEWTEASGIAKDVRELVRILNTEVPPSLVSLPLDKAVQP